MKRFEYKFYPTGEAKLRVDELSELNFTFLLYYILEVGAHSECCYGYVKSWGCNASYKVFYSFKELSVDELDKICQFYWNTSFNKLLDS
jgi:hypothetical protein